ncbi:MAG: histidinol-phosphate transaminase [Magnetovibrio sp.]|nr:histidinol-phosphate transaminase [Magnetovibrio sp.]
MAYTVTPRPGILSINPYVAGESRLDGKTRIIKLSSNEGPFGPSPKALAVMADTAQFANFYPDGSAAALHAAIAERFDLDADLIVCGAGSDEILSMLCVAYAGPGDEVLYCEHGFLMYPICAHAAGATPVTAPETNLTTDVDALLAHVTDKTRIVFVANPNNPTGTYLPKGEMARLRQGLPTNVLLVIDAAYAEFVDHDDYCAGAELVDAGQNTIMTRTFSKLFALGGLRVGWAYCPTEIADILNRVRGPFNVSSMGQAAAIASLQDIEFQDKSRRHVQEWRAKTEAALQGFGLKTTKSSANFVLVEFKDGATAESCDGYLRDMGIIVRRMASYGLPAYLRISIGTGDDMDACIGAIGMFLKGPL